MSVRNFVLNTGNGVTFFVGSNESVGFKTNTTTEKLDFTTGNAKFAQNVYVLSNLSIGHSNPLYQIDISGAGRVTGDFNVQGNLNIGKPMNIVNGLYIQKNSNVISTTSLSAAVANYSVTTAGTTFSIPNSNSAFFFVTSNTTPPIATIAGTGSVGIGTSNPTEKINIIGDRIKLESPSNTVELQLQSSNSAALLNVTKTGITQLSSSNALVLYGQSNITFFTQSSTLTGNLLLSNENRFIAADTAGSIGMGLYKRSGLPTCIASDSNDNIIFGSFTIDGLQNVISTTPFTEAMRINSNGFVGINKPQPQYRLDIIGDINFVGTLRSNGQPFVSGGGYVGWSNDVNGSNYVFAQCNVGIGTSSPGTALHIETGKLFVNNNATFAAPANAVYGANGDRIILQAGTGSTPPYSIGMNTNVLWTSVPSGASYLWYTGTTAQMQFNNGTLTCTGDVQGFGSVSDCNFKSNICPLFPFTSLNIVNKLRPVEFYWKDTVFNTSKKGKYDIGFIAQEVEKLIEPAVTEMYFPDVPSFKGINYERMLPHIVGAVQELTKQLKDVKKDIHAIKNVLNLG